MAFKESNIQNKIESLASVLSSIVDTCKSFLGCVRFYCEERMVRKDDGVSWAKSRNCDK